MRNSDSHNKKPFHSIERATDILRMFTKGEPTLTLSEISNRLNLSKATGHRYVSALRQAGLLRLDEVRGDYSLGTLVLDLASTAIAGLPVISVAEPVMTRLVRTTGETAVLSIWDGESPVVVRVNDNSDRDVTVRVRVGYRLGPQAAQSEIYLAHGFTLQDPNGTEHAMSGAEQRAARQAQVRVHTNELLGIRTVAAPVFLGNRLEAVMGLVGTTSTIPERLDSQAAAALVEAARTVSEGLPQRSRRITSVQ